MQHIVFVQYKYIFIGESMSVGFGYILPNIGEYMLVEYILVEYMLVEFIY